MRKVKIDVEDYHLKCGFPGSASHCPLAIAIEPRIMMGDVQINQDGVVELRHVVEDVLSPRIPVRVFRPEKEKYAEFTLPQDAIEYMRRIDDGEKVKPQTFEIEIPDRR
jgi:hypothetical protein